MPRTLIRPADDEAGRLFRLILFQSDSQADYSQTGKSAASDSIVLSEIFRKQKDYTD